MSSERDQDVDSELIGRAAGGDRGAFTEIVRRHGPAVLRLGRMLTGSPQAADDVYQETFLAAYRHAQGFRGDSAVRTWLLTIARNQAWRSLRRLPAAEQVDLTLVELGVEAGWGAEDRPSPEQATADGERKRQLHRALERLSVDDREVLVLRDLEGLSGPETAALLGTTLVAMKTRLHRARLRLLAAMRGGG